MILCVRILRVMKLGSFMKKFLNKNDGIVRITYLLNLGELLQCEDNSREAGSPLSTASVVGESSRANLLSLIEDRGLLVGEYHLLGYITLIDHIRESRRQEFM